jgi:hypothetical protein
MSNDQPDDNKPDELDDDAGVNAIRLDAERAREDLDKTLSEIERRLDPQRVIQPVKRIVQRTVTSIKSEYTKDPTRFLTVTIVTTLAVGTLLTWAGGGMGSAKRAAARQSALPALPPRTASRADKKAAKPTKPSKDPVLRNANKTSKRAILAIAKSQL